MRETLGASLAERRCSTKATATRPGWAFGVVCHTVASVVSVIFPLLLQEAVAVLVGRCTGLVVVAVSVSTF